MPIRCVLVDDEPLARFQLRGLLEKMPDVLIVGEAGRKEEALRIINETAPDLIFLDIELRGGNSGLDILRCLPSPPQVIFVTAFDQHAVKAFEVDALDYLLKPVSPKRLNASLDRFRTSSLRESSWRGTATKETPPGHEGLGLLPIGTTGHFIPAKEILFIRSSNHHSRVTTQQNKVFVVRHSLREWLTKLPESMFTQIDRRLIINRSQSASVSLRKRGSEALMVRTSFRPTLGARAAERLREGLGGDSAEPDSPPEEP
jgi:two-component system LytT family response regulator